MICNFNNKISKTVLKSYKKFETEAKFVEDINSFIILKSESLTEFDALTKAFNDNNSFEYKNALSDFRKSEFKTILLETVIGKSEQVTVDDKYDFSYKGLYIKIDPSIKIAFPILETFKGDITTKEEIFKSADFENELQRLFDKILAVKIETLMNSGVSLTINPDDDKDPVVSDNDLSERIDNSYNDDITDKIKKESDGKKVRDDFGVIDEEVFIKVFFKNASDIYQNEFDPYVKNVFRKIMFNDTIHYSLDKTIFNDLKEDMNENILFTLNSINIKYQFDLDFNPISNETESKYVKRISLLVKEKMYEYFIKKNGSPIDTNISFLSPEDRVIYYDLIITQNLNSVVNNNLNFIILSKDDNGDIIYKMNNIIKDKRTNSTDAKNGTTQNTEFVKSLISSTKRLVSIDKFTNEELIDLLPSNIFQEYQSSGLDLTYKDFLVSEKSLKFIMDENKPFISYNEYNALSIDKGLLMSDGLIEDIGSFMVNKKDDVSDSLNASFFSDTPIIFYNKFTGEIEKQYSLKRLMSEIKYHVEQNDDGTYELAGKHDSYVSQIFLAITSDINSREERKKLDSVTGRVKSYLNKDIEYDTLEKLNLSITENNNILDRSLIGKVSIEEEVLDDGTGTKSKRIILKIKYGTNADEYIKIPLKSRLKDNPITKDYINTNALIVEVDRSVFNDNFTDETIPALNIDTISKILETLNFPKDLSGSLVNYLGVGIDANSNVTSISDATNFITNLATIVYLNDDGESNPLFKEYLGIDTEIVKTTDESKRYTDLDFDPYTILWKARTNITESEAKKYGVYGDVQIPTVDSGRTNSISSRTNDNPAKLINDLRSNDGFISFKNNAIVQGEFEFESKAFITGIEDYVNNRTIPLKQMSLFDRYKSQNETYFLSNVTADKPLIPVRIFANDRTLPVMYMMSVNKNSNYKPIPLNDKGFLDETVLRNKLKDVKRKSLNDAQKLVLTKYAEIFTPENEDLIKKIIDLDPSRIAPEIGNELNVFASSLKTLMLEDTNNKIRGLDALLKTHSFGVDLLNIIEELNPGLYYNPKNGLMNEGFILELDLWNDEITSTYYNAEDVISLDSFIDDLFNKRKVALGKENYTKLAPKALKKLNEYRKRDFPNEYELSESSGFNMLTTAEHYNYLIFDELINPIRIGDLFSFQKGTDLLNNAREEFNGKKGNAFIRAYFNERAEAYAARSKRDSVSSSMGLKLALTEDPSVPVMRSTEIDFSFIEDEVLMSTLGSQELSKETTNDGLQFITRVGMIMRALSLSSNFRYDIKNGTIKDLNYTVDLKNRISSLDKKATHTMLATNQMSDAQYDIQRRLFENVLLSDDGSSVEVLVPDVLLHYDGSIELLSSARYKSFKTAQDIIDALGSTLNPNIDEDFVKILLLEENFSIRNKYPATISFSHTKKIGSPILNNPKNLDSRNGKIYYTQRDMKDNITILDLNKDVNEKHEVTMSMQQMYASLTGVVNKAEGIALFKAISSLYSVGYYKKINDLQNTLNNVIENPETYLSGNNLKNKNKLVRVFYDISQDISLEIEKGTNPLEAITNLEKRYNALNNGKLEAFIIVLKATIIDNLKETITTQSNSDAIQEALNNGANVDGVMNALYQSHVRTLNAQSLNLKINGIENVATVQHWIKVYDDGNGNAVTKSNLFKLNETVELKTKLDNNVALETLIVDKIEERVYNSKMTLVGHQFTGKSSSIPFIENNNNEIQKSLLLTGTFLNDEYLIIDKALVKSLSPEEDVYNKIISIINIDGVSRKIIIFDNENFFIDDVDLILSKNKTEINSKEYAYKDKTIDLSVDNAVDELMQKLWENGTIEYKC